MTALVKSLPKDVRRQLIPLGETIEAVLDRLATADPTAGPLVDALAAAVRDVADVNVTGASFDPSVVPDHLRVHFVVSDDEGNVHAVGDDLDAIKAQLAGSVRESIAAAAPIEERRGIVTWDVGDLPRVVESTDRGDGREGLSGAPRRRRQRGAAGRHDAGAAAADHARRSAAPAAAERCADAVVDRSQARQRRPARDRCRRHRSRRGERRLCGRRRRSRDGRPRSAAMDRGRVRVAPARGSRCGTRPRRERAPQGGAGDRCGIGGP